MEAAAPPAAAQGNGADVPAITAPVDVHDAEHAVSVADVEDVRPPVGEQYSLFAARLALHEPPDLDQGDPGLLFATEVGDDLAVGGGPDERTGDEPATRHVLLHLAGEPLGEVGAVGHHLHAGVLVEERVARLEPMEVGGPGCDGSQHPELALGGGVLGTIAQYRQDPGEHVSFGQSLQILVGRTRPAGCQLDFVCLSDVEHELRVVHFASPKHATAFI